MFVILRGDIAQVGREARPDYLGRALALDELIHGRIVAGRAVEKERLVALVHPEDVVRRAEREVDAALEK